jgi:peptidoglycan biosynthesis protein MviN/MurJ (putative lipid II flippase)
VALNVMLVFLLSPLLGAVGIVLATTVSGFVGALIQLWRLHQMLGRIGFVSIIGQGIRMTLAIAGAYTVMVVVGNLLGPANGAWARLLYMAVCALSFFAAYVPLCLVLRVREIRALIKRLIRR